MSLLNRLAVPALVVVGCAAVCSAATGAPSPLAPALSSGLNARVDDKAGRLEGVVTDDIGTPLGGVAVTVQGARFVYVVSDPDGKYVFEQLRPGPYVVRAQLPGFIASERALVRVLPASATWRSLRLQRIDAREGTAGSLSSRSVLTAGVGGSQPGIGDGPGDGDEASGHDDSPTAWRVRHAKRSVLREVTGQEAFDGGDALPEPAQPDDAGQARLAAELWSGLPLSAQVQFLTTSNLTGAEDLFSPVAPRGVAYVTVSAPIGHRATWAVQGAMTQGDLSSWVLGGSYAGRLGEHHAVDAGMTYAAQQYEGGNPLALAAVSDTARTVGALFAFDEWTVSRAAVTYGARYARYGYLDEPMLMSPSVSVRWSVAPTAWIRGTASREMLAPGAEEFVPSPVAGMWLPPQRTFSSLDPASGFTAQEARHLEIAFEREMASFLVAARGFREDVDDQIVTLFGVGVAETPTGNLGHYYTANAGDLAAFGWGLTLSRAVASRLRGSVSYTITHGMRRGPADDADVLTTWAPSVVRVGSERLHDVTTVVETDIPETATRVYAAYRVNSGFASASIQEDDPTLAARFDVQVAQRLPFLEFTNTQWEVLFAIRNLFRDLESGAYYDELLVVRPPTRIVGGVMVRF